MFEAKLTSKGQITVPIEIRRLLNVEPGEKLSFDVDDDQITIHKANRPLSIQERFAHYDITQSREAVQESMQEIDTGDDVGEEK